MTLGEYCQWLSEFAIASTAAGADGRFRLPGSKPQYAPDRDFDATDVRLEIDLQVEDKAADGVCTTTLRAFHDGAGEVTFDAVDMKVSSASSGGRKCRYTHKEGKLKVQLPRKCKSGESVKVEVRYRLENPKLGIYFVHPDKHYPNTPTQVWTQGQDEYARYWFPCHDAPQEKATTEMVVTVPDDFTAVSNGRLVSVKHAKRAKRKTFHWRIATPHSMYLVTLAAGRWVEVRDSWAGIPVTYYTEKDRVKMAKNAFGKTPKMMKFFSESIGVKYPYEKYAQVAAADFIYGGMENTSATTQTDIALCDDRAKAENWHELLVAHELAHQWFGDLLTCKDWSHAWLNESFATYFDSLFHEHEHGYDSFRYNMLGNARSYFGEDKEHYRRPIVTNVYKEPTDIFDRHLYEKGSCVLHMLRHVLGDDLWWKSINTYVTDNRGGSVETVDLVNAVEKATGQNLRWFFDQWVFRAGHPEYRVRYDWDRKAKEAVIWVVQEQRTDEETGLFRMPIVFEFRTKGGRRKQFREWVEEREHTFRFKLPAEPELFCFDPGNHVLKRVKLTKPRAMWLRQLETDRHAMGRIMAAKELGRIGAPWAVAALAKAFARERFWGVQAEIAGALGKAGSPEAYDALVGCLRVRHVKARRAVVEALGTFKRAETLEHVRHALAAKDSYHVPAEALRSIGKSQTKAAEKVLKEHLEVDSWNDVIRWGAIDGLARLNDDGNLRTFMKYTELGHNHLSRAAAVRGLGAVGKGRPEVTDRLVALIRDRHIRVQMAAIQQLAQLGDPRALEPLKALVEGADADRRLFRAAEEAMRSIREGLDPEKKGEEELKRENAALKKKLRQLEKRAGGRGR
ncbi:MAG TPA: M1 family aminopeptidase [Candidatus Thermoplasmatota archaeon]